MRCGFTFIELMSVFAIIAILAAILFPVFARAREKARQTNCLNNLANIGAGLRMYAQDYYGHFPPDDSDLSPLFPKTLSDPSVLLCPSQSDLRPGMRPAPTNDEIRSDYVYIGGLADDDLPTQLLAADLEPEIHNEGANYLYLDCHVKWSNTRGLEGSTPEGYDTIQELRGDEATPAEELPLEPGMEE